MNRKKPMTDLPTQPWTKEVDDTKTEKEKKRKEKKRIDKKKNRKEKIEKAETR